MKVLQNGSERFRGIVFQICRTVQNGSGYSTLFFQNYSELFRTVLERFCCAPFFLQNGSERFREPLCI